VTPGRVTPHVLALACAVASCRTAPAVVAAPEPASNPRPAAAPAPGDAPAFRLASAPPRAPVRWLGPYANFVRVPDDAIIANDGTLISLTAPEDELREHVVVVKSAVDHSRRGVGGAWFASDDAVSLLTPAGLEKAQNIPKRGTFLRGGESGMDWRGNSPFSIFGANDGLPAFLGDCATGAFGSACARSSGGTWRTVRFHAGLERMRDRWWSFAIIPARDRLLVLEREDEACIASWKSGPFRPCRQRFLLHDAQRGVVQKYSSVPLWAYHGSNSFMNGHSFHLGEGGVLRMWPVDKDDGELDDAKTGEKCAVDFLPDGTTAVACRAGSFGVAGACALWHPPGSDAVHETCDAGATWRPIRTPTPVTPATQLVCLAIGCNVGDHIRLGWGER
jgi:hypothetical protein